MASPYVVAISPPCSLFLLWWVDHARSAADAHISRSTWRHRILVALAARESLHTHTHTHSLTYTHIWCEVWKSVHYHFVILFHWFLTERSLFLFIFFPICWQLCVESRQQSQLCCCDRGKKVILLSSGDFFNFNGTERIVLLWASGGFAMTSRRNSARLKLRRSFSEQLRSSTSKAWDLLWRNVRERRLAGQ